MFSPSKRRRASKFFQLLGTRRLLIGCLAMSTLEQMEAWLQPMDLVLSGTDFILDITSFSLQCLCWQCVNVLEKRSFLHDSIQVAKSGPHGVLSTSLLLHWWRTTPYFLSPCWLLNGVSLFGRVTTSQVIYLLLRSTSWCNLFRVLKRSLIKLTYVRKYR